MIAQGAEGAPTAAGRTRSSNSHTQRASSLPEWLTLPSVLSCIALGLSLASFYFQLIHTRGARVTLLNDGDEQASAVLAWSDLPRNVQNDFPNYAPPHRYALVRLVVLNTGDRPGFAKIESASVEMTGPAGQGDQVPRVLFYTYVVIPALAVVDKLIVVYNLPEPPECKIIVHLKITAGGPVKRFRPSLRKVKYDCVLPVKLLARERTQVAEVSSALNHDQTL